MRVVVQRVRSSRVTVSDASGHPTGHPTGDPAGDRTGDRTVGEIQRGLMLLVGIAATDTETELQWMARKCLDLRLFPANDDPDGRWDQSVQECGGSLLIVSQFTLYGDCRKGRRPSFSQSAAPDVARPLFDRFVEILRQSDVPIATGEFGAMMQVEIHNDGPVTLLLEREAQA